MDTRDDAVEQIVQEVETEGGDGTVVKAIADLVYEIERDAYNNLYFQATIAMCIARFTKIYGVENTEALLQESLNAVEQIRIMENAQKTNNTMSKH